VILASMMTLEFIAAVYVALCIGATIGYVIAGLLANASER
jgi:xanthine/uracil/vitamin C permease (AzgA family)